MTFDAGVMYREAIVKNAALATGKPLYVSVTGLRLHYAGCSTATAGLMPVTVEQAGSMLMCWNCQPMHRNVLRRLSWAMERMVEGALR